jgi:hypothetical protein
MYSIDSSFLTWSPIRRTGSGEIDIAGNRLEIGGIVIGKTDFIGVPSRDSERSRRFYVETLGLRPDERGKFEFWAGETCFGIWEPEQMGMEFAPQKNAHPALHVDDVAAARAELEAKGVAFNGEIFDTASARWLSSPTPTATT